MYNKADHTVSWIQENMRLWGHKPIRALGKFHGRKNSAFRYEGFAQMCDQLKEALPGDLGGVPYADERRINSR